MTAKLNYLIFSLAVLTGVAVRTVMLLFTVDQVSGFIKPEYTLPAVAIVIFLVAAAAVVFFSAALMKTNSEVAPTVGGIPFSLSCILMAAAMVYETFFSQLLDESAPLQSALHYVFTLAAALSLCFIAFCKLTSRAFPQFISVAPVLFWMMRLIMVFTEFSTISTISDTVIETASMCLSLLTFLFYAKIECAQATKKYRIFFAVALVNGFVCAIGSVPRIIADILSVDQAIHLNTVPTFTSLATAVFSVVFAYTLLSKIKE